jgi:hypothetical protein
MSELPNVQENNEQILNDIQSLQQMEQQLFSNLESNPNLSTKDQQQIIEKMNQLSNMRVNLYQTLSGVNNYFESALNTSIGSLKEQVVAIGIVENELNRAKKRLEVLEEEKNNKIRLVEINNYYGDKYAEHSQLMKIIIFILIPVIILAFLNNKGILPNTIYYGLVVIISFIGAYFFWMRMSSIWMRDNMNYQEYDWGFDPNNVPMGPSVSSTTDPWASGSLNFGTCVGNACCSGGLVYDSSMNQCVASTTTTPSTTTTGTTEPFITESMVNNILTQKQQGKYKDDINLKQPNAYNK